VEEVRRAVRTEVIGSEEEALRGILVDVGADPDGESVRQIVAHHLRRVASGVPLPKPVREPSRPPDPPPVPPFQIRAADF
jgi:hypothetical protein